MLMGAASSGRASVDRTTWGAPMSRYLVETDEPPASDALRALDRAQVRTPEVAVEQRYRPHDGTGPEVWLCRAPNAAHVEHWARSAGLVLRSIRQVDLSRVTDPEPGR